MDKAVILQCKVYINNADLTSLQAYIQDILTTNLDYRLPYEYIFQHIYIHACLKKHTEIARWLKDDIYENNFDIVQKIALRQVFNYGNYLLHKD
jgi:hypothetical protein